MVVLRLSVVPRGRAIGLLATKGIHLRIAADREKGRASWRQVGLPAQLLPRRRFRRALRAFICTFCMRVCIYVFVCICADMYIYIYMCMCVCICICMRLYTCVCEREIMLFIGKPKGRSIMVSNAFIHMCMCMCMHICA